MLRYYVFVNRSLYSKADMPSESERTDLLMRPCHAVHIHLMKAHEIALDICVVCFMAFSVRYAYSRRTRIKHSHYLARSIGGARS